jgi:hypothetical protein
MIVDAVGDIRRGDLVLHVNLTWLALSGAMVLATYLVLIWSWLYVVKGLSNQSIPFLLGARIWFISALGTLLPGRIWQVVQMSAMSSEAGVSPVASATAAIINAAVNIATGIAVGVIAGMPILEIYLGERAWIARALAAVGIAGILALPMLVPWAFRVARRFGVSVPEQRLPTGVIAVSTLANVASWFLYGAAFLFLNRGIVDSSAQSVTQHTAAYATSYVLGYLAIPVPAGMGVREGALQSVMVTGGLATHDAAVAISLVSRLWLLLIMVLPALIFLAYRRPKNEKDPAAG